MRMHAQDIRKTFLDYFEKRGHAVRPSSSLIQHEDPTVLFTTAGMQQFKPYFLGEKDAQKDFSSSRVATVQRCLRTSDAVDEIHLTFFEMLGNFSFGDYFKKEAITLAWDYLTRELRLDPHRMWVTVFGGDQSAPLDREAEEIWKTMPGMRNVITRAGKDANWWGPTGATGPCGPSSELHYDTTGQPCEKGERCRPNDDCGRFLEVWNLVFTEFNKTADGTLEPLPAKNIDTGMGLERLTRIVQGKKSLFETELFHPIIALLRSSAGFGQMESEGENRKRERIVADHLRGTVALVADGVEPGNKEHGYVLRKIVRTLIDQFADPHVDLAPFLRVTIETLKETFPAVLREERRIMSVVQREQNAYERIVKLDVGAVIRKMKSGDRNPQKSDEAVPSERSLTADEAFQLFTTYGLSPERLAREGYSFDAKAFEQKIAEHQQVSRAGVGKKFGGHGLGGHGVAPIPVDNAADLPKIKRLHTATHLLQQALRDVLGDHVQQMGSDITPERLRFDFTHPVKLTDEERKKVEDMVNAKIQEDLPMTRREMRFEEAKQQGALAFFRERYPERVSVFAFGDWSKEICGGPHVDHTAEVGEFRILSEKSSSSGIRRIKAVVGEDTGKAGVNA